MKAGAVNYVVKRPDYLQELRDAVVDLLQARKSHPRGDSLERERELLIGALEEHGWNVSATARALGMSRGKLRGKMRALEIE